MFCVFLSFFVFFFSFFSDFSLFSLGWPVTQYIDQTDLKFTEVLLYLLLSAGIKILYHHTQPYLKVLNNEKISDFCHRYKYLHEKECYIKSFEFCFEYIEAVVSSGLPWLCHVQKMAFHNPSSCRSSYMFLTPSTVMFSEP